MCLLQHNTKCQNEQQNDQINECNFVVCLRIHDVCIRCTALVLCRTRVSWRSENKAKPSKKWTHARSLQHRGIKVKEQTFCGVKFLLWRATYNRHIYSNERSCGSKISSTNFEYNIFGVLQDKVMDILQHKPNPFWGVISR